MAQTGYTPIQIYSSPTTTNVPLAANLAAGELAINTADGKLFYKDNGGVVQVIGTKGGVGSSSTTQVLYNSSGAVVGSANMTFNGTVLTSSFAGPVAATTLSASSTVSGTGFSTYLASPPAIGGTAAAAGAFTTLSASSTVSGTGFSTYLASPPAIGGTAAAAGSFTTLTTSSTITDNGGTANGVTYLNGSKVVTSGTALVFDGTNLGLGVTPSAWVSPALPAFDIGTMGAIAGQTNAANLHFLANAYFGSGPAWKYKTSNYASRFTAGNDSGTGGFSWFVASSGTAGNAITFTQAMTLDASGNLSVGTTTNTYSEKLNVLGGSQITGRHRGYVFANAVSAGTTGTYNVDVTGFVGQGSGTLDYMASFYYVTFLSNTSSHQLQGVAMYTNDFQGNALLLATIGKREVGGTLTFSTSGTSPRITATNTSGNTPTYYCQVCYIN